MSDLLRGGVRLSKVSRSYQLRLEHNQTLKETVLRRRRTRSREVVALRDVDLEIPPGTALGVVGANGAGKSTLLTVIAGILPADSGTVETSGRVVSLLELGAGFHPDFTGRENVVLNASIHGMSRREIERRMESIIAFSELDHFIDAPVRTYSTGMYMRLGFSVAAALQPDILLLDEVLAVGDAGFQQKCIARMAEFQRGETTIVFVSHARDAVRAICDRAIWLVGGRVAADGRPQAVLAEYESALSLPGADATSRPSETWHGAHIDEVRVTDGALETDRFVSGDPFRVEVAFSVVEPITPVVAVRIATADGALIAASDNRTEAEGRGAPGPHFVSFTVDALPLQEGRFAVDVALEPPDGGEPYHRWARCAVFRVYGQGRGYGPVAFRGQWGLRVGEAATP